VGCVREGDEEQGKCRVRDALPRLRGLTCWQLELQVLGNSGAPSSHAA